MPVQAGALVLRWHVWQAVSRFKREFLKDLHSLNPN